MMEYSKTACGRRTQYAGITCADDKCVFSILGEKTYKGEGLVSKHTFKTEPDTLYFLRVTGRVVPPEFTNFQFGICDSEGLWLENHLQKREKSFFVYSGGTDQQLTIRGQDGSEYTRGYVFTSGSNEEMSFFTDGEEGEVVLSEVRVFKMTDAIPAPERTEAASVNWVEDANTCDEDKNIINDMEAWAKPFAENCEFVGVADGVIRYESKGLGYYYIAWLPIQRPGIYDVCFKSKVIEKGQSRFGVITQNAQGKRRFIMEKNNAVEGKEDSYADMYAIPEGVKLGFALFNRGGKIDFSDFKFFFAGDAKNPKQQTEENIKRRYSEFS